MAAHQVRYAPVPSIAQEITDPSETEASEGCMSSLEQDEEAIDFIQASTTSRYTTPVSESTNSLVPYDKAYGTRNACVVGLSFSFALSMTCISLAPWAFRGRQAFLAQTGGYTVDNQGERTFFLGSAGQELVKLAVNIAITICTDCLGYIHSTSCRWALSRESRLEFNSNLRLLASTRTCSSSRWSMNFVSAFLLMTCYAASGQLFISTSVAAKQSFIVNGIALIALGVGIFGQATISTLSLVNCPTLIPSWSSNPMNTVLVMRHHGLIEHRPSRCMQSIQFRNVPPSPRRLEPCQPSLRRAYAPIKYVTRYIWALFTAILIWAIVILNISLLRRSSFASREISFYGSGVPALQLRLSALLVIILFQASITLGLHIAEILVNLSRDESEWQRATKPSGAKTSRGVLGSVKAASLSWQSMLLLALKSVSHWLFGISIGMKENEMVMNWQGLLPLSAVMLLLALFASFLVRRTPKSPQPATFGHLQTLCDLIDVWPEHVEKAIWWGDKGQSSGKEIRHAGTSGEELEAVKMDKLYAG